MASNKVWNLMYTAGDPALWLKETAYVGNPLSRREAIKGGSIVAKNGWRVWVEHKDTGERIFQSAPEIKYVQCEMPKQTLISTYGKPIFYLRIVDDNYTIRRVYLMGVKKQKEAIQLARERGFNPTCSASSMDMILVSISSDR